MIIALTGNPNSGKTTMYNALTGKNEKIGNWAGVTVEKKEAVIKGKYLKNKNMEVIAVDLPGAYSMSPFTSEESITSEYVKNANPDVIINIVDATNLSRSLFFTTQLLELGIPVVVALNKTDINDKKHTNIDINKLSIKLNCPVIETVSTSNKGLKELIDTAVSLKGKTQIALFKQSNVDFTNKSAVETADRERFEFVNEIVSNVETKEVLSKELTIHDKIDSILTKKWVGIPLFAVVMFLVFWISQSGPGLWIAEGYTFKNGTSIPGLVGLLNIFINFIDELLIDANPILRSILLDGILGGFSAVVGFLPLVMVMYFLIALLEDCGYMARVSVVLDPIFKKVGLSGKSVIPFVIGTGCAIPGVMACRTIKDEKEKNATAMLAPFMPCGAKLPVIALFAGAFFPESKWVGVTMYFLGIIIIFLCALLIKTITKNKNKKSYFIIELPEYKAPSIIRSAKSMLERGWSYIVKAGTIILVCNFVVHLLQSFSWSFEFLDYNSIIDAAYAYLETNPLEGAALAEYWNNVNLEVAALADKSMLRTIASPIAYMLAPIIGTVIWQLAAATVTGFIAKENVVGTIAICFAIPNLISTSDLELIGETSKVAATIGITQVAALAFLMFNLFSPPCFAAIGAMNSEIKNKKWLFAGIGMQFSVGFISAFLVFFFGTILTKGNLGDPWMPILGWVITAICIGTAVVLVLRQNKKLKA